MRNKLKRATDKTKKEYLESIYDEIMEFQRAGLHDFMYIKTEERNWKEKLHMIHPQLNVPP